MTVEQFCGSCGHSQKWHNDGLRKCNHMESLRPYVRCDCESFVSPEPSRRAAVDVDAVMGRVKQFGDCKMQAGMSLERGQQQNADDNNADAVSHLAAIRAMLEPHDAARLRETVKTVLHQTMPIQYSGDDVVTDIADAVIRAIGGER